MTTSASLMQQPCPICASTSRALDVVDFNKTCNEGTGKFLPLSGLPVYYFLCDECGFCFAPEICQWPISEFENKIYNDEYITVDPDYIEARPRANADGLIKMFAAHGTKIRHLDYGGGSGLLSKIMRDNGWNSSSYDPFANRDVDTQDLGVFDLITAYEVFEHVPDPKALMKSIASLLAPDGVLLFSTLTSDGNIKRNQRLSWWYAAPRNGHISLFSKKSLSLLVKGEGFSFGSFTPGFHILWKILPSWAQQLSRKP